MPLKIRKAKDDDFEGIWEIFHHIVNEGTSFIYKDDTTREKAHKLWMEETTPFVAVLEGKIVGFYLIRQNKVGRGSHVCNAAYMVHHDYRKQNIGQALCEHSLNEARKQGYKAMQFNIVVSTNHKAVALWMKMGFEVVGTIPQAFDHKELGLVDAYIMHRFL
ncbi:MAG: GNAT family N-acetyltransferase [Rickettsiales bacterium]|nr:GNAT family N-acetyltransferase [Pseudomonadota bacterium]MDA0965886.1 GNAT family N-acetyltransferase [Pseudomonadota bacterium]MDG4542644.1 GNAT family N-acetyltransferase [Rickettsiales bacterium]MDG4545148.1 GNAT family N-acetyltransferase [Rickettsiales bacterium]MDG4547271.1 GNAT family N-acetyltransferase [Rickettsiales bacterium]